MNKQELLEALSDPEVKKAVSEFIFDIAKDLTEYDMFSDLIKEMFESLFWSKLTALDGLEHNAGERNVAEVLADIEKALCVISEKI